MPVMLDLRSLNRATLARQRLLARSSDGLELVARAIGGLPTRQEAARLTGWARLDEPPTMPELARASSATADVSRIDVEEAARRHLAAWGPATVADIRAWSGHRGVAKAVEAMVAAGVLIELVSWTGATLVDLPDGVRPRGDTPAPPRLLPAGDPLLRGLADRERIVDPAHRSLRGATATSRLVLVDGFLHGTWHVERRDAGVLLRIEPFGPLATTAEQPLLHEASALLRLLHPAAAEHDVRLG